MSARNCLLCGKPLSRIWVGAGEDFCSREHRNQYRLRKGMDRLQEASKVATLMRRRELPKPVSAGMQPGNSDPRMIDSALVRLEGRSSSLALPFSKWTPPARIPAAKGALPPRFEVPPKLPHRECGILRKQAAQSAPRLVLSQIASKIDPPGANYLERTRRPKTVPAPGRHGSALR